MPRSRAIEQPMPFSAVRDRGGAGKLLLRPIPRLAQSGADSRHASRSGCTNSVFIIAAMATNIPTMSRLRQRAEP
jgi:hypothetical protein